jgi:nicotinamidase-related amidase
MIDAAVRPYVQSLAPRNCAVLYGVETHVCVRQTALDLLESGFDVHLVVDSVSSMNHHDRNIAIEFLRDQGVHMTSF